MSHILGRYEENAGKYYQAMLDNAAGYEGMEIRKMSRLTGNLLKAIDYEKGKSSEKRIMHFSQNCSRQRLYLTV